MKKVYLLIVGQAKEKAFIQEEKEFIKRLKKFDLEVVELKHAEDKEKNDQTVLNKISQLSSGTPKIILLDERGKTMTSMKFSEWLFDHIEVSSQIFFVIGGAEGHGKTIKEKSQGSIRLSDLTLAHRHARLIFVEQLYRAETIYSGHPYHK